MQASNRPRSPHRVISGRIRPSSKAWCPSIGVSPLNPTPNAGRLAVTLRSSAVSVNAIRIDDSHRPAQDAALAAHPRHARRLHPTRPGCAGLDPPQPLALPVHARPAPISAEVIELERASCSTETRGRSAPVPRCGKSEAQEGGLLRPSINVDRALQPASLGVSMQSIGRHVEQTPSDSARSQRSTRQSNQYRVVLEADASSTRRDPAALAKVYRAGPPAPANRSRLPPWPISYRSTTDSPTGDRPAAGAVSGSVTLSFNHGARRQSLGAGRARGSTRRHDASTCRARSVTGNVLPAIPRNSSNALSRPALVDTGSHHHDLHRARRALREPTSIR